MLQVGLDDVTVFGEKIGQELEGRRSSYREDGTPGALQGPQVLDHKIFEAGQVGDLDALNQHFGVVAVGENQGGPDHLLTGRVSAEVAHADRGYLLAGGIGQAPGPADFGVDDANVDPRRCAVPQCLEKAPDFPFQFL